ncbi:sugar phosphate nucleotidyltransferase [Actinomycetospora soli]|uniref:sugar phosphate nucleotidyltransferase n=1 Tax=Actinomycetospora soli TaxID=2893887 RepID=UPI001E558DDF|nr:NDP-sugar synthase [Actinomycetospora soli]MCD2189116.1 NDP-sugar synthase [Actinomycetospora soli]
MTDTGGTAQGTAAVVLVGGQGSRLRPLTSSTPKPMLPTAGVPFIGHLLSRIAAAGIRRVVLGTSYRAEVFADYLGDGSAFGLELECVPEPEPLGTGGGIRHAAAALDPSFEEVMVFNGDILSGVDLGAVLAEHRTAGADATLHLVRVPDPTAFGCVPTDATGRVQAFLEKTLNPPTDQVNAGCYVFRRAVIDAIPEGRPVSVERETFPGLLREGRRLQGHVESSYWLDLGTPAAFVRGCADLVQGIAPTSALPGPVGTSLLLPGAKTAATASVSDGSTLGRDVVVGDGSRVIGSVVMDGARIGDNVVVTRSVIGPRAVIGDETVVSDAVVGDDVSVGAGCELRDGVRLWPGLAIPDGGLRFSGSG